MRGGPRSHWPQGAHYRFVILALVHDKRNDDDARKAAAELLTEMERDNKASPKEQKDDDVEMEQH